MKARSVSILAILSTLAVPVFARFFSLAEPETIWKHTPAVRLCWEKSAENLRRRSSLAERLIIDSREASSLSKSFTRSVLTESFPVELTGISLLGFSDCPEAEPKDEAPILYLGSAAIRSKAKPDEEYIGQSSVGDERVLKKINETGKHSIMLIDYKLVTGLASGSVIRLTGILENLPKEIRSSENYQAKLADFSADLIRDEQRSTIQHEFGHVLGLRHEQARSDVVTAHNLDSRNPDMDDDGQTYPFCRTSSGEIGDESPADSHVSSISRLGTPYDLFSIMNDCQIDMIELAHQAKLLCDYRTGLRNSSTLDSKTKEKLERVFEKCSFIQTHPYKVGLSATDKFAIKKLYQGADGDASITDFRKSATLMQWIDVLERTHELQK